MGRLKVVSPKATSKPYFPSACSMTAVTSAESGVVAGSKRETTLPLRSTRNLVKFHLISPAVFGLGAVLVRYLYSGVVSSPFTDTLDIMGNETLNLRVQKVLISSL